MQECSQLPYEVQYAWAFWPVRPVATARTSINRTRRALFIRISLELTSLGVEASQAGCRGRPRARGEAWAAAPPTRRQHRRTIPGKATTRPREPCALDGEERMLRGRLQTRTSGR